MKRRGGLPKKALERETESHWNRGCKGCIEKRETKKPTDPREMVLWLLCIYRDSTTSPPPRAPPSGFPPPVPHRLITTWAYTKQTGHTKRGESMNGSMRADANESDGEECLTSRRARRGVSVCGGC